MTYLEFYSLTSKPFVNACNPDFYYEGYDHIEALNRLIFLIEEGDMNFGMLTGEIGCGKTMTRQMLKRRLDQDLFEVIDMDNSNLDFNYLLLEMIHKLSPDDVGENLPEDNIYHLLQEFQYLLDSKIRCENRSLVVILDEAQQLSAEALIELKNLTNIDSDCEGSITIILVGQPELRSLVKSLPQIDQRVSLRFHLNPLSVVDVRGYVATRLRKAGHETGELFTQDAIMYVAAETHGIPREINRVCQLSLNFAFSQQLEIIDLEAVKAVIADLHRQQGRI
ncbi:MAG: AAA family ATPase [Planctomycetes bacterium]|nr:AAA family ATPase [Planctomycetota bacterium]